MDLRKIAIPSAEYFSDAELRTLFSKELVILPIRLESSLADCWKTYEKLKRELSRVLGARTVKDLPSPEDLAFSPVRSLTDREDNWRFFSSIARISLSRCELCARQLRSVQKAHILSRRFFKSLAFKRRSIWRAYEASPTNTLLLCGHCHDVVDKDSIRMPRLQLRRLLVRRRRTNRLLAKLLREDIRKTEMYRAILEEYRAEALKTWQSGFRHFLAELLYKKDLWHHLGYVREKYYRYLLNRGRA